MMGQFKYRCVGVCSYKISSFKPPLMKYGSYYEKYCDEMPESGIQESFPRQRAEAFPL
jgi:hypothetical protein